LLPRLAVAAETTVLLWLERIAAERERADSTELRLAVTHLEALRALLTH
jgi:hypothetical protein